ncbi:MAG: aminoglycoside phosphotransferase family protein [Caulobacteraceae bacterium]
MSAPIDPAPRTAKVVLTTRAGEIVGVLPPLPVASPWWQEVEPVVAAVREAHGIDIVVLRLLATSRAENPGGEVTYLAEVEGPARAAPFEASLADHPLRAAYARPGGPAADLDWARKILAGRGLKLAAPPVQVRTWNLSSLWRLETEGGTAWLKVLPAFIAREGRVLTWLAGEAAPELIGAEGARVLMAAIPGRDFYGAQPPDLFEMVSLLVDLQSRKLGLEAEMLALGLADWRAGALSLAIASAFERSADELDADQRRLLDRFVDGLPGRMGDVAACGLPDTLVHGDFHPGNVRGVAGAMRVLDWGEAGVGHPLLDQAAMFASIEPDHVEPVRGHWAEAWRAAAPRCDPMTAFGLLRPVAIAKQAAAYWNFLDNIEPSEHPYHRADPAARLRRAAAVLAAESASAR